MIAFVMFICSSIPASDDGWLGDGIIKPMSKRDTRQLVVYVLSFFVGSIVYSLIFHSDETLQSMLLRAGIVAVLVGLIPFYIKKSRK